MEHLISKFPKINKIHYETLGNLTKNTCLFIPKGIKLFAWFTYYNNKFICLFYNPEINKIFTNYVCFKEELSLGTIIYGTLLENTFICETLHYYKNEMLIVYNLLRVKLCNCVCFKLMLELCKQI